MINDKEGSALEANSFGNLLVNHLKIKKEYIDLTPALEGMGAYKYLTQENMSKLSQMGNWHEEFPKNDLMRKVFCYAMVRHRLRLVEALRYAEEHNLLEVGGAHKVVKKHTINTSRLKTIWDCLENSQWTVVLM